MNRDKQIEEMAKDLCGNVDCDECAALMPCFSKHFSKRAVEKNYRKASDVARETVDDFQNRLRHIFLNMCEFNDYNTLNLLQIDNAIEALYDTFIAELKKKYTEACDG